MRIIIAKTIIIIIIIISIIIVIMIIGLGDEISKTEAKKEFSMNDIGKPSCMSYVIWLFDFM